MGQTLRGAAEDGIFQRGNHRAAFAAPIGKVDAHPVGGFAAEYGTQLVERRLFGCADGRHRLQRRENIALFRAADHGAAELEGWQDGDAAVSSALGVERDACFAQTLHIAVDRSDGNLQLLSKLGGRNTLAFEQNIEKPKQTAGLHAHSSFANHRITAAKGLQGLSE